jgi:hypothetical protein
MVHIETAELQEPLVGDERSGVPPLPLTLSEGLSADHLPYHRWSSTVAERALAHTASFAWSTEHDLSGVRGEAVASNRSRGGENVLLYVGEAIVYATVSRGRMFARAAAHAAAAVDAAEAWLRERVPEVAPSDECRIGIHFWTEARGGPYSVHRTIDVAAWPDVADNYPRVVRSVVAPLVDESWRPSGAGRLVLWYGPPGTGKTHALRSLAWHWRDWCDTHYITDPEAFFGSSEYMLDVLTSGEDDDDENKERWRLLVLEDTGELLSADAKLRTGQGLSRFLNVVDGLIGQGLRIVVLVTTNEPLGTLHPAAARPGRCAAAIEFVAFPADEAREWLVAHGHDAIPSGAETLADLYGRLAGVKVKTRRPIGFAST